MARLNASQWRGWGGTNAPLRIFLQLAVLRPDARTSVATATGASLGKISSRKTRAAGMTDCLASHAALSAFVRVACSLWRARVSGLLRLSSPTAPNRSEARGPRPSCYSR